MTVVTTDDQEGIVIGNDGIKTFPALRFQSNKSGFWQSESSMVIQYGATGKGIMLNATHLRPTTEAFNAGFSLGGAGKPFEQVFTTNLKLDAANNQRNVTLKAPDALGASYSLEFPADAGSDGQVLTTAGASGVLTWTTPVEAAQTVITSVTNAALVLGRDADNDIDFSVDNNITFRAAGADQIKLVDGVIAPVTDNDIALGTTALRFSDLFLAEGGVINCDNGDLMLAQAGDVLTLGGDGSPTLTATLTNALSITANGGIGMTNYNGSAAVTDLALDIDGMTDIGAAIASGDLIIVDDGAGGTNRKSTIDRVATLFAGTGLTAASAVIGVDGVLEDLNTLGAAGSDGQFMVATGAGAFAYESGNTARTSLALGTGDSPTFTGITATGNVSHDGGTYTFNETSAADLDFRVESDGNQNMLFVDGSEDKIGIGMNNPAYTLDVTGTINATGSIYVATVALTSDQRYKKNITSVTGALEKLSKLNPVNYDWRKDEFKERGFSDKKQWGFIAQEVEKVMPELVREDKNGYQSLNYTGVIPLLTKAMQEQQTEMDKQQKEIDELKAQLQSIMKMLDNDMSDKTNDKKADDNKKPVKLSMATVK